MLEMIFFLSLTRLEWEKSKKKKWTNQHSGCLLCDWIKLQNEIGIEFAAGWECWRRKKKQIRLENLHIGMQCVYVIGVTLWTQTTAAEFSLWCDNVKISTYLHKYVCDMHWLLSDINLCVCDRSAMEWELISWTTPINWQNADIKGLCECAHSQFNVCHSLQIFSLLNWRILSAVAIFAHPSHLSCVSLWSDGWWCYRRRTSLNDVYKWRKSNSIFLSFSHTQTHCIRHTNMNYVFSLLLLFLLLRDAITFFGFELNFLFHWNGMQFDCTSNHNQVFDCI